MESRTIVKFTYVCIFCLSMLTLFSFLVFGYCAVLVLIDYTSITSENSLICLTAQYVHGNWSQVLNTWKGVSNSSTRDKSQFSKIFLLHRFMLIWLMYFWLFKWLDMSVHPLMAVVNTQVRQAGSGLLFSCQGTYSFDIYKKMLLERACLSLKLMTVLPFMFNINPVSFIQSMYLLIVYSLLLHA